MHKECDDVIKIHEAVWSAEILFFNFFYDRSGNRSKFVEFRIFQPECIFKLKNKYIFFGRKCILVEIHCFY